MSIELHSIDCIEYMKGLDDNAFELAIVDPPYGIGESGGNESRNRVASKGYKRKEWDNSAPNPDYFDQLKRVSKNQIIHDFVNILKKSKKRTTKKLIGTAFRKLAIKKLLDMARQPKSAV